MRSKSRKPDYEQERALGAPEAGIAGVDEAGRGPLAGPVVAAAVVLDPSRIPDGLHDSKKLTPARREALFEQIRRHADTGVGTADVAQIEAHNIHHATLEAMRLAVAALAIPPAAALIDGKHIPVLPCKALALAGGDARCLSIAAASIIAKVTRDRLMAKLAESHPGYGWERNQGYGTPEHLEALKRLGVTPAHRRTFAPVRNMLGSPTTNRLYFVRKTSQPVDSK